MTAPLDLDGLDALLAKATPGPWEHDGYGWLTAPSAIIVVDDSDMRRPDAEVIVALRNDAPTLVAELRAAREALMCCALPLEVLAATECDVAGKALAPETKAAVMNAVKAIRLTLSRAATGGNSNG